MPGPYKAKLFKYSLYYVLRLIIVGTMHTLIICEKPSAAKAIAEALAEGKPKKFGEKNAVWYEFERSGKKHIAVPAVGHLFTLKQKGKGWSYPVFDIEWIPSYQASKLSSFSEPYFKNIESLTSEADDFIIATDYDDEGEIIGVNILNFICKKKEAARMKFSTMTTEELIESYTNANKKLDKNLAESGFARHYLDWYWGINMTRALTNSIKAANKRFRILSTGRVQGPVLHMLTKHEKKIQAFVPTPFWQLELHVKIGKNSSIAEYTKDKIWDKEEARKALKKASVKSAKVREITRKNMTQSPPKPYNTTSMLADIYRYFGYSPLQGMNIAENLYQAGYISYPRTASEKLPKDIGYSKIITALGKAGYSKEASILLKKSELKPEEGTKSDSAHPAIYPTAQTPKTLGGVQQKVYDLIVRRFMACFGDPAKRQSQKVALDAGDEMFIITGKKTVEAGWLALYGKYGQREDIILPDMKEGDSVDVTKTEMLDKATQPPARFSQGSVLKEMEARSLGTKATRSTILQILYNRGYVIGDSIEVTELGMSLSDVLERNVPDLISEKLTKHFEEKCDAIERGELTREALLDEAKKKIEKIGTSFKQREKKIGEDLTKAVIATQDKQNILGKCNSCGGTLKVHKNWRTRKRFVGCSGYPKGCRTGYPLPREGVIFSTPKICDQCKTPIIQVRMPGRRPFRMCLDPECKTKSEWLDKNKLKAAQIASRKSSKEAELLKCKECNKQLKTKRALTLHMKKHDKGKKQ